MGKSCSTVGGPQVTDLDRIDRVRLAFALHAAEPPHGPTPDCLDDDTIAALADGSLAPAARAAVLPHVAACGRCRAAVASVTRALADPDVAREIAAFQRNRRERLARLTRIVVPLAAASLVLLLSWPRPREVGEPLHRAPTITAAPAPAPVSPVGVVEGARRLSWRSAGGADRYRVTLFDAGGRVVFEAEVPDTTVALPDSVRLAPTARYLWKIEARTTIGRWVASELFEFSIAGEAPQ